MAGILENKILKIRFFTHFSSLLSLLIVGLLIFMILLWLKFERDAIKVFGILFLVDAIPALFLHFEYWLKNKGEEYEVRDAKLIRKIGGEDTHFRNDEIEKVIIYLSPSLYKNSNFHLLAIESYHYAVVKLKSGEELVLTCLLSPRIDMELRKMRGVLFEKKKRLFCMIS